MARPVDWHIVGQPGDPTPGESWGVRQLAGEYGKIATVAGDVATIVKAVKSTSATGIWIGTAGDSFRTQIESLPDDAAKCAKSYGIARDALNAWAAKLDDAQSKADTNLNRARIAVQDLERARAALSSALVAQSSASTAFDRIDDLYRQYKDTTPPPTLKVPSAWQVQQSRNATITAAATVTNVRSTVSDAQARLDAAKRLIGEAKDEYETAAKTTVAKIQQAKDAGVEADTWWESIYHSEGWKVFITIVNVVVTVLAVVALFTPLGPLALAVLVAGTALAMADTIAAFASGEMTLSAFVVTMALTFVPGGKLLRGLRSSTGLAKGANVLAGLTKGLQRGKGAVRTVSADSVRFSQRTVSYTKVDRVTGRRYTYDDIVDSMREQGWKGDPIDVVHMRDGGLTSLDNTRVLAARETGTNVRAVVRKPGDSLTPAEADRFFKPKFGHPSTWGEAADIRIQSQSGRFGESFPQGSHELPRVTGKP